ncbi:DUF938 domain-containing protein [Paraburkholderia phosphatilytica]|uniref:DUF938 domain-containing protein n=1 Tax=Paraburkholderia phosphatilytica TaxID=2282883 RepID=UPI000E4FD680|nr:DUF938 domain-containing protein [Paraburkholderia phosphatilytica]
MTTDPDPRQHAPAADRNREPILAVLRGVLPRKGLVLEIASGTGQHVTFFAAALRDLHWQPSDPDADARASIAAWTAHAGLSNVRRPLEIDVTNPAWGIDGADAMICINMIHISPWASTRALFDGARRVLTPGAPLVLYGPYRRHGTHTAPSNEAFDAQLRQRNPAWGVRDLESVVEMADAAGFDAAEPVAMPANNFCVIFHRR